MSLKSYHYNLKMFKVWKETKKNTGCLGHNELFHINCMNLKQIGQAFIFIDVCIESSCSSVYFVFLYIMIKVHILGDI